jgi:hypothetical protein
MLRCSVSTDRRQYGPFLLAIALTIEHLNSTSWTVCNVRATFDATLFLLRDRGDMGDHPWHFG